MRGAHLTRAAVIADGSVAKSDRGYGVTASERAPKELGHRSASNPGRQKLITYLSTNYGAAGALHVASLRSHAYYDPSTGSR